jgi:site-specific recombinase XerD
MSPPTKRALSLYLRDQPKKRSCGPTDPVFRAEGGQNHGGRLTPGGLLQIITNLGQLAGITGVRCSPHTFRHTFAVEFLRAGGNVFTLQQMLGHTDLKMTRRYVSLAAADMDEQHRRFSPVARLLSR